MLKKMLSAVALLLILVRFVNANEDIQDVREFVNLLSKDATPTLADFYHYYGQGSELELELMLNQCEKEGWKPVENNPKCKSYIESREKNRLGTPSLFFKWLKTKLPPSPSLKLQKVERIRGKDKLEHDLIYVKINGENVAFFRTIGQENAAQFGVLGLSKINGVSVDKLLKKDLASKR